MSLIRRESAAARAAAAFRAPDPVLAGDAMAGPAPRPKQADPRDIRIAELRANSEALTQELASLKAEIETVRGLAHDEGREAGRKEAESQEAERLKQLAGALTAARQAFDERLSEERDIGIDIALAALRKVLGNPAHYRDLVTATALHHAAGLARTTVIQLSVSSADFPDETALSALQASLGKVRVVADPAMPPGSCKFDLTHGQLNAEIPAQAAALEALLGQTQTRVTERV